MKKKNSEPDMLQLFKSFKADVLDKKQSHEQMVKEVYMMKFKIRPLQGDISKLNFSNATFVETIWQLGKMDDFIEKHIHKINKYYKFKMTKNKMIGNYTKIIEA